MNAPAARGWRGPGRRGPQVDRQEMARASMSALCPGAFDGRGPMAEGPAPAQPEKAREKGGERGMPLLDPAGRLRNASEVNEGTALAHKRDYPARVMSVVVSGAGPGAEVYGETPVRVVVMGYRPGALAYFMERRGPGRI